MELLTQFTPTTLTLEHEHVLSLAKALEAKAEEFKPFAPGRTELLAASRSLRAYIASQL